MDIDMDSWVLSLKKNVEPKSDENLEAHPLVFRKEHFKVVHWSKIL